MHKNTTSRTAFIIKTCYYLGFYFILLNVAVCTVCAEDVLSSENRIKRELQNADNKCNVNNNQRSLAVNTTERLSALRSIMEQFQLDAYIIPMDDEHQSEYVSPEDARIKFISGFTGSAGTAIVTLNEAALWTDGRYFLQAATELDCNWILMKSKQPGVPRETQWLRTVIKTGIVGISSKNVKEHRWQVLEKELNVQSRQLKGLTENLVDKIWKNRSQSSMPEPGLIILNTSFSGMGWQQKTKIIRESLNENSADGLIVTALDNVAWLFNLRGNDIPFNPVFKAYAVVSQNFTKLFVRGTVITDEIKDYLQSEKCSGNGCVQILEYDQFESSISEYTAFWNKVWITPSSSHFVHSLIPKDKLLCLNSPIELLQSVKNPIETQGLKEAHIRDAVALIDFMALLEDEVKRGIHWDELKASAILSQFRKEQALYRDDSFLTVSAFGSNGAVIHYRPTHETNKIITTTGMYLIDSGGQYLDGTTDVTRTFHFGEPTAFQREVYTRVLKGAINVLQLVFKSGLTDNEVDLLARRSLMQVGLNYLHGTGHGIGAYLNVHEGPFSIRPFQMLASYGHPVALQEGMFMSDEPGYYHEGEFGVRLETIMTVVEANTKYKFDNSTYLTFEAVTLVPFEPHLIEVKLLTHSELEWLNEYHGKVEKTVGQELKKQNRLKGYQWMITRTRPIISPYFKSSGKVHASSMMRCCFVLFYIVLIVMYHI